MADLLQSKEPRPRVQAAAQWKAFLELGFRPLYLAGSFWAAMSVAIWVFAPNWLHGQLGGVLWHAHEMLWGFIATIAVGFLLTAGANWTGINPIRGLPLGVLSLLWVVARLGYLLPSTTAFWLAASSDVLFFAWAAVALGRAIYGARSQRNYGVPVLVLALALTNALYLTAASRGDYARVLQHFNLGLLCMAVIALLIARRIIPFFAMRAVPGLKLPMLTRSGHWQLAASCLAIGFYLLGWIRPAAMLLALAGVIALVQWQAWKPWAVRKVSLLWILYLGYAALGVGLLVAAANLGGSAMGWEIRPAWPAHVIGVAGFSVLIIGMLTRTALGHLGRPLVADRLIVSCYLLVIAAAVLRLLALLPSNLALGALHASASAWVLAFALYLWRFFPMMIRPRADQKAAPSSAGEINILKPREPQ